MGQSDNNNTNASPVVPPAQAPIYPPIALPQGQFIAAVDPSNPSQIIYIPAAAPPMYGAQPGSYQAAPVGYQAQPMPYAQPMYSPYQQVPLGASMAPVQQQGNETQKLLNNPTEQLAQRDFESRTSPWIKEGWTIYKRNWLEYSLWALIIIGISCIPYVGAFIALGLQCGIMFAVFNILRPESGGVLYTSDISKGLYLLFPVIGLAIVQGLFVAVGLLIFIIPGIYLLVVFSFSLPVYVEFYSSGVGIFDSMTISRKVIKKHFWDIFGFLIVLALLNIAGACVLLVGVLVSYPVTMIAMAVATRDIFGLTYSRHEILNCVVCC